MKDLETPEANANKIVIETLEAVHKYLRERPQFDDERGTLTLECFLLSQVEDALEAAACLQTAAVD